MAVKLFFNTGETWEAMYKDCQAAKSLIEFEQYIIRNDDIGNRFLTLFRDKAREGVKVRLLFDRVGSRQVYGQKVIQEIRENGGRVTFYNAIGWLNMIRPSTWFPRNHTKVLLIDSKVAFVGGVCLADYMKGWQDMHARLTGEAADEVEADFASIWKRAGQGKQPVNRDYDPGKKFDYCLSQPALSRNPMYEELLEQIRAAKKYIYIATPYFLAPSRLRRALRGAAGRGVDIRIMVTELTDVPFAVCVSRSYFPALIRKGMRFFFYKNTVLHAKYTVVDGRWAMLGSMNMDYLSLLYNREANLLIREKKTVEVLAAHFLVDQENCREIAADFLKSLPLPTRLVGYLGRCLKKFI